MTERAPLKRARTSRIYRKPDKKSLEHAIAKTRRKAKNMSTPDTFDAEMTMAQIAEAEVIKAREDRRNQVTMTITRPGDAQSLEIYIKAPVLAEIIRKMSPGSYTAADYDKVYKPILLPYPWKEMGKPKPASDIVITRPAVQKITPNFKGGTDFEWDYPRACLLYNPDALTEGFKLTYKVDKPIAPDTLRKWGKMFMDGCNDIIANARPFKMSWVMDEQPQPPAPKAF